MDDTTLTFALAGAAGTLGGSVASEVSKTLVDVAKTTVANCTVNFMPARIAIDDFKKNALLFLSCYNIHLDNLFVGKKDSEKQVLIANINSPSNIAAFSRAVTISCSIEESERRELLSKVLTLKIKSDPRSSQAMAESEALNAIEKLSLNAIRCCALLKMAVNWDFCSHMRGMSPKLLAESLYNECSAIIEPILSSETELTQYDFEMILFSGCATRLLTTGSGEPYYVGGLAEHLYLSDVPDGLRTLVKSIDASRHLRLTIIGNIIANEAIEIISGHSCALDLPTDPNLKPRLNILKL